MGGLKRGTASHGIAVTLNVKAGAAADFESATLPLMNDVQTKESGNLLYLLGKDPKDAAKYIFLELYSSSDAINHHGSTDYFKAGGKRQAPFMDGKPNIEILRAVG